jgi:hypothetical protein
VDHGWASRAVHDDQLEEPAGWVFGDLFHDDGIAQRMIDLLYVDDGGWAALYAKPNLERATLPNYASVFNKHLLPRIGHVRLRDLSVPSLMRLRADLEADGVGRQAVRKSLAVLQSILQRAVEWERIGSNPARSVRKPPMWRDRAITPLTPATVERIRAAVLDQGAVRDGSCRCSRTPVCGHRRPWRRVGGASGGTVCSSNRPSPTAS